MWTNKKTKKWTAAKAYEKAITHVQLDVCSYYSHNDEIQVLFESPDSPLCRQHSWLLPH